MKKFKLLLVDSMAIGKSDLITITGKRYPNLFEEFVQTDSFDHALHWLKTNAKTAKNVIVLTSDSFTDNASGYRNIVPITVQDEKLKNAYLLAEMMSGVNPDVRVYAYTNSPIVKSGKLKEVFAKRDSINGLRKLFIELLNEK